MSEPKKYVLGKHIHDTPEKCGDRVARELWGVAEVGYAEDYDILKQHAEAMAWALREAATSLKTLSISGRKDAAIETLSDVRGFARSRAGAAEAALDAYRKEYGG